jgi:subtilisin-like proprotein convertase family protein
LVDRAGRHVYEVARDEVYVRRPGGRGDFLAVPFSPSTPALRRNLASQLAAARDFRLVFYEAGAPHIRAQARVLTGSILLRMSTGAGVNAATGAAGVRRTRSLPYAPNCLLAVCDDPLSTLEIAAELRRLPGVLAAEPQLARAYHRNTFRPNDPYFNQLWHLEATPQNGATPGADIDVIDVWDRFRGAGRLIGIIDDAIQLDHPDLAPNIDPVIRHDFLDDDDDPSPVDLNDDFHGTGVSGLAAARGNNGIGVTGAAFEAGLAPLRLINGGMLEDTQIADAFAFRNDAIDVKNNSWGSDTFEELDVLGFLVEQALDDAALHGRGGRGTIMVFSAGNERDLHDNLNYNGLKLRPDVIPVGATAPDGKIASFSTPGAPLVVSAPGDLEILTCDLTGSHGLNGPTTPFDFDDRDYTRRFTGTSASAPLVSGVVALMLQANPNLGWRDVQEILMRSAKVVGARANEYETNAAGFHFSHRYGAGLVQAGAAVALAEQWINLAPARSVSRRLRDLELPIPESDRQGVIQDLVFSGLPLRVEHALVTLDVSHPNRGQLVVTLTSPQGMQSRLAETHPDTNADYQGWTFQSRRHWGEASTGKWTVEVRDAVSGQTGTLKAVAIELRGAPIGPVEMVEESLIEPAGAANGDGAVQAGEAVGESVVLRNVSNQPVSGVTATLSSSTPGVTMIRSLAAYPDLASDALGTNEAPFLYRIAPEVPCGTEVKLTLVAGTESAKATNSFSRFIGRRLLSELSTNVFEASPGLPLTLPDIATVFATNFITPPGPLFIDDVKVSLRIDHTAIGDLQIALIHPDGTEVLLAGNRGGDNPNMGTGVCGAGEQRTEFDDAATRSISEGQVPFVGSWRPDEPLSTLRGKPLGGVWRLRASDVFDEDSGVLFCWAVTAAVRVMASNCEVFVPELRILNLTTDVAGEWLLRARGAAEIPATLEASVDLTHWQPIANQIPKTQEFEFRISGGGEAFRFLRVRQ